VYVTDHGTKNAADTANNRITLWGDKESLSVRELRALLERLDPGVRVVTLMSQCFSGSFAHLIHTHATDGVPPGRVCGYFASTADRPAYGCYPENRGRENVGHSFQFFQALAATPRFADAHRAVLVADATPDVPIASSDTYLDELLHEAAAAAGEEPMALVDDLLRAAWRDKAAWEHEIRLLDRIGQTFGIFSPRSLAELEDQAARLPEVSDRFRTYGRAWSAALDDLRQANLDRFLAAHPRWAERLAPPALEALDATQRRRLTRELLDALAPFTRADAHTTGRLDVLHEKAQAATAAAYRMEVRLGVVLRMRAVLASVAGRVLLARGERPAAAAAHAALRACEDLGLDTDGKLASPGSLADAAPFPALDEDIETAGHVLPAWMGIRFRAASPPERRRHGLPDGAAVVLAVYPDSPAEDAGFAVGDFVLGPAGTPFTEPHQIREWTMLSPIGEPAPLDVLRASSPLRLALVPEPYPLAWPELPGPPKVGSPAPALALAAYRGAPPSRLDDGTPRLLFFWATWCLPCKAALPEVLAFSRERATPVVAITDELPEQLDAFFRDFHDPFPPVVAVDEYRRTFLAYGVSGTPTFVLIDGAGKVQGQSGGYRPDVGLGLAGWSWARRGAAP
jgi:thiol-disulfide isomerase/thioredoxin